jgi:hypothetical protein
MPDEAILPVHKAAIGTVSETSRASAGSEGYRQRRNRYTVFAGFSGRGEWTLPSVAFEYDLPTRVDDRACVTDGEWARVSVFAGGVGGSLEQIAEVFDTDGKQTFLSPDYDGFRYQIRSWQRCRSSKVRKVTFHSDGRGGWFSYWG